MTIFNKEFPGIDEYMLKSGFDKIAVNKYLPIMYCREKGRIGQFYQADLIRRNGYIRLTGEIGVVLLDQDLNEGLDLKEALDPVNYATISIRIESFPSMVKVGTFLDGESRNAAHFVDNLIELIDDCMPYDIESLCLSSKDQSSWIFSLMSASSSSLSSMPINKVFHAISKFC